MSNLREQMKVDLDIKGFSPSTKNAYIMHVKNYAKYFSQSPDKLSTDDIKAYLHYLITQKKVSSSYVNSVYSALKFFYETTMQRDWEMNKIPRTKKEKRLPIALSPSEVTRLFNILKNIKHKAILMTIYASGLRISEATNLKVSDIDSKEMKIYIKDGKGKKDRYSILSKTNLEILKEYYKVYRPIDWLFEGRENNQPISERSIQKVFQKAVQESGINNRATVHSLRHSFATHLLECGTDIYSIQQLMGHTSIKTTSIYIHVTRQRALKVVSPLDSIGAMELC